MSATPAVQRLAPDAQGMFNNGILCIRKRSPMTQYRVIRISLRNRAIP